MADIGRQHDKVTQLVSELGENAAGECIIGGAAVERLADQYGTPLFVYSGDFLERHVKRVQQALGPDVDLYYSLKANP
ncbi:MAG: hypothetical protein ACKVVP_03750, partial [Chloroflexota bacterium]